MKAAKHRRRAVKTPKAKRTTAPLAPTANAAARKRLWQFAQFVAKQNPEALAAQVTMIRETLYHAARVEIFFQRYRRALYARKAATR